MQPRDVGGGGRLEGLELGAADEQVRKACSHEKLAAEGDSRVESLVLRTSRSARRAATRRWRWRAVVLKVQSSVLNDQSLVLKVQSSVLNVQSLAPRTR